MRIWLAVLLSLGCNRSLDASSGADLAAGCLVDPAGPNFTFHVTNRGARMLRLVYGCGSNWPITVETAAGPATIGLGGTSLDFCAVSCEYLYATPSYTGVCSDCGPGSGALLGPGTTVDIVWDRRTYQKVKADPACSLLAGAVCSLGRRIAAAPVQATLEICDDGPNPTGSNGACGKPQLPVQFTLDPSLSETTIDVP